VADFSRDTLSLNGIKKTTKQIAEEYWRSKLKRGDVLLSIGGTAGRLSSSSRTRMEEISRKILRGSLYIPNSRRSAGECGKQSNNKEKLAHASTLQKRSTGSKITVDNRR
jgi:hypothetical protein